MIKIAICEDEEIYQKIVEDIINSNFNLDILSFTNAEKLLDYVSLNENSIDIFILDIELPEKNGLEAARKIRNFNRDAVIIFLTNYESFVFDSFEVNTFRFIPKARLEKQFIKAMNDAIGEISRQNNYINVKAVGTNETIRIDVKNILSLEKRNKTVEIFLDNGTVVKSRITLKQLLDTAKSDCLITAQKGVVVNVNHIIKIDSDKLTMTDNSVQYVSRNNIKNVKQAIAGCWR